jgi:hypothetical protein
MVAETVAAREQREISEAILVPKTEPELREDQERQGQRLIVHRGRGWKETRPGLLEPLHPMARLSAEEATWPSPRAWGFRAVLADSATHRANGSMPAHLLGDVATFGPHLLSANRRYHLRRSRREVRIVQLLGPHLLETQGYEVFVSSQKRTRHPYRELWTKQRFLAEMARFTSEPSAILLVGLVGDRLGGWIAGYAIDATAYVDTVDLRTEMLSTQISTGLHIAFTDVCRRSPGVREIMHGMHVPEDAALTTFKEGVGFPVVRVPTRVELLPLVEKVIRGRRPFAHYRLTGRRSASVDAAIG